MTPDDHEPDSDSPSPSAEFASAFTGLVGKIKNERGLSLRKLRAELRRRGIKTSEPSLSRFGTGKLLPTEELVRAVCDIAYVPHREADHIVALLSRAREQRTNGVEGLGSAATSRPSRDEVWKKIMGFLAKLKLRRRVLVVTGIVGVLIAIAVTGGYVRGRHDAPDTGNAGASDNKAPGDGTETPALAADDCNRYRVGPKDLWLRDEWGGTTSEMKHNQVVTVETRNNPAGLPYWYVTSDDGRRGWTDGRYLVPLCK